MALIIRIPTSASVFRAYWSLYSVKKLSFVVLDVLNVITSDCAKFIRLNKKESAPLILVVDDTIASHVVVPATALDK